MTIRELNQFLEARVPRTLSCSWDNDGLSCCPDPNRVLKRVLIALDVTEETINAAIDGGYDLLLTHHPLIFRPIKALEPSVNVPRKLLALACGGISAIALHTRLDAFDGGVNDALADTLGFSVCGSIPCEDALYARVIRMDAPISLSAFAALVKEKLDIPCVNCADAGRPVQTVALIGGEGGDFIRAVAAAGCDTYLTGRAGYHAMLDAAENGINVIEAGHFATERPVCARLRDLLIEADPALEITLYTRPTLQIF